MSQLIKKKIKNILQLILIKFLDPPNDLGLYFKLNFKEIVIERDDEPTNIAIIYKT